MHFDSSLTLGRHVQNGLKLDSRVDSWWWVPAECGWFSCPVWHPAYRFWMILLCFHHSTDLHHVRLVVISSNLEISLNIDKICWLAIFQDPMHTFKKGTPIHKASQIIWHHSLYSSGKYDQHDIWRVSVRFCDVLPFQRISFRISLLWFPPFLMMVS